MGLKTAANRSKSPPPDSCACNPLVSATPTSAGPNFAIGPRRSLHKTAYCAFPGSPKPPKPLKQPLPLLPSPVYFAYAPNNGIYPSARQLDTGVGNLIADLASMPGSQGKTMLDETLLVVKGEFGRTVGNLNGQQGRDHYYIHSTLIGGGGVQGGRALGKTTPDAAYVEEPGWSEDRPVYAEDIAATIYSALGINYTTVRHDDPLGRGFEYIPQNQAWVGKPITELFR